MIKRKKLLIGIGTIIGVTALGYLGHKYVQREKIISAIQIELDESRKKIEILNNAASEGLFDDAISTTERKIFFREDKIKYLVNKTDIKSVAKFERYKSELDILKVRRDGYLRTQEIYNIANE